MEDVVQIIEDGVLLKILWRKGIDKNEKRIVKEKILANHLGKLCVEYDFDFNDSKFQASNLTTLLPEHIDSEEIKAAFLSFFSKKKFQIKINENNINVSSITNENGQSVMKLSIRVFYAKRKILIEGNPENLLKFISYYYDILKVIDAENQEPSHVCLIDMIFNKTLGEINLDLNTEDPINISLPEQIEIPIIFENNDVNQTNESSNISNESSWQQKILGMFTELQQSMKGLQFKLDTIMPSVKKIESMNVELKECQTRCFILEENNKELSTNVSEISKNQKKLENAISEQQGKISEVSYEYQKLEQQTKAMLQQLRNELMTDASLLEQKITNNISKEVEHAISMSAPPTLQRPLPEIYNTYDNYPKSIAQVQAPPPSNYATVTKLKQPTNQPYKKALPQESKIQPNQTPENNSSREIPPLNQNLNNETKTFEQENVLIGDSNIRYISARRFPSSIAKIRCPTLQKLPELIKNIELPNVKKILLHLGTNDIETATTDQFQNYLINAITSVNAKFPEADVSISSILPRADSQQVKVIKANDIMEKTCADLPWNIPTSIMYHPFINPGMLNDAKHLDRIGLKSFITEIKTLFFGGVQKKNYSIW